MDAVTTALEQDGARRAEELLFGTLRQSFNSLSARERDVVARVAAGALNKQIAAELGLSEVTVKVRPPKAMRRLHAKSLAELVRMIEALPNHRLASAQLPSGRPFSLPEGRASRVSSPPSHCRHLGKVLTDISGMRATSEAWPKGVRLPAVIVCTHVRFWH